MALVVTAIAATLAASLLFQGELQISRTHQQARQLQAWQLALGLEAWAQSVLDHDARQGPPWDSLDEPWAQPLAPTALPGGSVAGRMIDLSGRINLNALIDPSDGSDNPLAVRRFRRLVTEVLGLDPAVAERVLDYLDPDTVTRPLGDESGPGLGYLRHEQELAELPTLSESERLALLPFVSALPRMAPINVNTAPVEVLMALAPDISATQARDMLPVAGRPWESVPDFLQRAVPPDIAVEAEGLSIRSSGFRAHAILQVDGQELHFYSDLFRGGTSADSSYHVRNRRLSAW